jgi:glycosyltransferase involved in cell wall biosynthesis
MTAAAGLSIGIDARLLADPYLGGMKTYCEELLPALMKVAKPHRYTWYLDRPLPDDLKGLAPQVVVVPRVLPVVGMPFREQLSLPRRMAVHGHDLVHFPCNTGPVWPPSPTVLTLLDVLQLDAWKARPSNPRALWTNMNAAYAAWVMPRLASRAVTIVTISQHARLRIIERLGADPEKVEVTYLAARTTFSFDGASGPLPEGLDRGFVLGMAAADPRKNPTGLLTAYAGLPEEIRVRAPLVIVCTGQDVANPLDELATRLRTKVVLLPRVPDKVLADLYRAAAVFAFPTFDEGFGLPVLEAMASGAPVITSSVAAIPEVAGDAATLVDPHDTAALRQALAAVLKNGDLAASLRARGLKRSAEFSWRRCAEQTSDIYERAYRARPRFRTADS